MGKLHFSLSVNGAIAWHLVTVARRRIQMVARQQRGIDVGRAPLDGTASLTRGVTDESIPRILRIYFIFEFIRNFKKIKLIFTTYSLLGKDGWMSGMGGGGGGVDEACLLRNQR